MRLQKMWIKKRYFELQRVESEHPQFIHRKILHFCRWFFSVSMVFFSSRLSLLLFSIWRTA